MSFLPEKNLAKGYLPACLCALSLLPIHGQTAHSSQQRMQAVQNHLSRYVIIRGSKNSDMSLVSRMRALRVPVVSIAAIRDGAIDWKRAYGVYSIGGPPVSTEILFAAASVSKPVTALGFLKLVEQGKIDLDAKRQLIPKMLEIPDNREAKSQGP